MKKFLLLLSMAACMGFVACSDDDADDSNDPKKDDNGEEIIDKPQDVASLDYVDFDLPSGTLWATCNIGAKTPEDLGNVFAWGETEPSTYDDDYKFWTVRRDSTYDEEFASTMLGQFSGGWRVNSTYEISKYITHKYKDEEGTVDKKAVLDDIDDAAVQKWGNGWRMPTEEEYKELIDNTEYEYLESKDKVYGVTFTNPRKPDAKLFFPIAPLKNFYDHCGYWSKTLDTSNSNKSAKNFCPDGYGHFPSVGTDQRTFRFLIRPVRSK